MKARALVGLVWFCLVMLMVLAARWLAYALAPPNDLSHRLEGSAGGPRLVVVSLVAIGLSAALSAAVVWLVALGVQERRRLSPERVAPPLDLRRLAFRSVGLFVGGTLAFALLESYLHWREGLGFHGFVCLLGPVHRNVLPLLGALALVTASVAEAGEHLFRWVRATVRELIRRRLPWTRSLQPGSSRLLISAVSAPGRAARPRAPPLRA